MARYQTSPGKSFKLRIHAVIVVPILAPIIIPTAWKDDPETFGLKLEERIQSKGREVGWNLSGSSRKWLNRTGNSQEGYDGKKSAGEQSVVWIKSTDS